MSPLFGTFAALAGVVAVFYLIEALRRAPRAPEVLLWARGAPTPPGAGGGRHQPV
jgi:hypothetical protein